MSLWRLQEWYTARNARIDFNIKRKKWARQLLKTAGLSAPEQETSGEFAGITFRVWIGPRGGVRIKEIRRNPRPFRVPSTGIGSLPILEAFREAGI